MATYYVSKAGNDSNAGTAKSAPKLTIASAISSVTHGDTVEILDQGTYAEDDLPINYNGLTFTHTASELGRAKINAGGNSHAFEFSNVTGTMFRGLEIYNCSNYAFHNNSQAQRTFHITGCFFHDINKLTFKAIEGNGASGPEANEPATIFESIIYGDDQGNFSAPILVDGRLYIRNSFITASTDGYVVKNYAGAHTTASFSTFINRHASTTYPVVQATKIINCIITGSSSNLKGLACDNGNHTYNLVNVGGTNFRNLADNANGSTGTGEITGSMPIFLDGGSIGNTANIVGNYYLQESSPAIDAGVTYNSIDIDISGTARPQDGAFDIGCFEYIVPPVVPPYWAPAGAQSYPNFGGNLTVNRYQNLTSNYRLAAAASASTAQSISSGSGEYNISIAGNWSGTYTGSEVSGSGSYNISGSGSGSSEFVLSSSGDHSGSYSGSISYGTGSYCISGSGVITLLSGSGQYTGSYCSGAYVTISGTSGYNLTGTYTCYYFCGSGSYYVSGSSIHTLSGSGTGTGSLATASYYISGATSYNITGASEYYISGTHEEAYFSGTGSMTLSGTGSYNFVSNVHRPARRNVGQVPFSLGTPGAISLRGRTSAYCVTVGGDPSTIIQTSSA